MTKESFKLVIIAKDMILPNILIPNESKSVAMETSLKNTYKRGISRIQKLSALIVLFAYTAASHVMSQDVKNVKNSLKSIKAEQERIAHDEFMSYVYMTLGFAVVIGIAWSTTVMARNRNRKEQEKKQAYILRQQELKKHTHGHAHSKHRR